MERKQLIKELKEYFVVEELVCNHTYAVFLNKSWQFFDKEFLEVLLILRRDVLKVPMTINNWHKGGQFSQRGFRCNICQLVRDKTIKGKIYLTSHANGCAIDFDAKGLTVAQVHKLVKENIDLFPCKIRMEAGVTWNHLDIYEDESKEKYSEFSV